MTRTARTSEMLHPIGQAEPTTAELDLLIPSPLSPVKKWLTSLAVLGATLAATVAVGQGYVYPDVEVQSSLPSVLFDESNDALSFRLVLLNRDNRDFRVTGLDLDAPGDHIIGLTVREGFRSPTSYRIDVDPTASIVDGLNVVVEPGSEPSPADSSVEFILDVSPQICAEPSESLGYISVTVDFGDGAFPPISRTTPLHREPLSENYGQSPEVFRDLVSACEAAL